MHTFSRQRTLSSAVSVEGYGYWTGKSVCVDFHPAPQNTGLVFVRHDLRGCPRIPAQVALRSQVERRTCLSLGGDVHVDMVEHVLATLYGLCVDNCEIWVNAPEMPGLDGSALPYVEALDSVGYQTQDAMSVTRLISSDVFLGDELRWIRATPPSDEKNSLILGFEIDFPLCSGIGHQKKSLVLTPETFRNEIAPARTFMLEHEAYALLAQGLGAHATEKDLLVFGNGGVIGNTLRFSDECVRHKLLDLIGDLALGSVRWSGAISACRSGHAMNEQLVACLISSQETI